MDADAFQIEKNVPIAPHGNYGLARGRATYPFAKMFVGDSFFVPCAPSKKRLVQVRLTCAARRFRDSRNSTAKFKTRSDDSGVRVWRTA